MAFREDFVWGAASSAYQTEGFPAADGGGESIWDVFCRRPGTIANGDDGSAACDGYHCFAEDIGLLASLGLSAYRFSTSWARIDPNGDGQWNEAGLRYYDRVVDCCLANGVTPWMTLYHWELPQALEVRGGWLCRKTAEAFARFAGMMAAHFSG
ncbi:MAG: glycoside hydrolase family 1 protein, partial [Oscillospiraceae bacterium]